MKDPKDYRVETLTIERAWDKYPNLPTHARRWRCSCGTVGGWLVEWDLVFDHTWPDESKLIKGWQEHFLGHRCRARRSDKR